MRTLCKSRDDQQHELEKAKYYVNEARKNGLDYSGELLSDLNEDNEDAEDAIIEVCKLIEKRDFSTTSDLKDEQRLQCYIALYCAFLLTDPGRLPTRLKHMKHNEHLKTYVKKFKPLSREQFEDLSEFVELAYARNNQEAIDIANDIVESIPKIGPYLKDVLAVRYSKQKPNPIALVPLSSLTIAELDLVIHATEITLKTERNADLQAQLDAAIAQLDVAISASAPAIIQQKLSEKLQELENLLSGQAIDISVARAKWNSANKLNEKHFHQFSDESTRSEFRRKLEATNLKIYGMSHHEHTSSQDVDPSSNSSDASRPLRENPEIPSRINGSFLLKCMQGAGLVGILAGLLLVFCPPVGAAVGLGAVAFVVKTLGFHLAIQAQHTVGAFLIMAGAALLSLPKANIGNTHETEEQSNARIERGLRA